jgi:hypothetical protein
VDFRTGTVVGRHFPDSKPTNRLRMFHGKSTAGWLAVRHCHGVEMSPAWNAGVDASRSGDKAMRSVFCPDPTRERAQLVTS